MSYLVTLPVGFPKADELFQSLETDSFLLLDLKCFKVNYMRSALNSHYEYDSFLLYGLALKETILPSKFCISYLAELLNQSTLLEIKLWGLSLSWRRWVG